MTNPNKINSINRKQSSDSMRESVEEALFSAIDLLNETLAPSQQLAKSRDTILADSGGRLDSMAVVNLLVFLEDELSSRFGRELDLVGADPLEPEDLKSVGFLCDALCRKLSQ